LIRALRGPTYSASIDPSPSFEAKEEIIGRNAASVFPAAVFAIRRISREVSNQALIDSTWNGYS